MIQLAFDRGTLKLHASTPVDLDSPPDSPPLPTGATLPGCRFDKRTKCWRAPAHAYRQIILTLRGAEVEYLDDARAYDKLDFERQLIRKPFPHQQEAVEAWWTGSPAAGDTVAERRGKGVVVLPTGAGKTFLAHLAMEKAGCSTLVITPTLDLMQQWYSGLLDGFDIDVGLIGGGYYEPKAVTVTTYDSAYIHMERLGNRYGLLVFDECHHLPGPSYASAAECSLAPFRLGLTATPEREDGEERQYEWLIGPTVYRREIRELAGSYLADYETIQVPVRLSDEERREYEETRAVYLAFVQRQGLQLGSPQGWRMFLMATSRSRQGREAFLAYQTQKRIAQASEGKLRKLEQLMARHRHDRVLIFTHDNATVYRISRQYLVPAITHQTKVKERHDLLRGFNDGEFPFLVTSKVLNEGVDVPAANVGIVLSGSGSVREHVQRLGRILRKAEDKQAVLYEVVSEDTAERYVSQRRRRHGAYQ